ncbi:glutamine synthetase family protein [Streptomyces sp. GbtcB6]|uniref:glutamine synthetase family protein n=1 Tax=Streptomyces sp. GbtcB6 TaxID=2824751 RepID=UPI001C30046F|nr:glutamine synthetase family protein [Streptomyces sp. GbtcB6]
MSDRVTASSFSSRSAAESLEAIRKDLETGEIDTILVGGADSNGAFRAKRLPVSRFARDPSDAQHFSDLVFALDHMDAIIAPPPDYPGWFPNWSDGFGDINAVPDLTTYRRVPWLERTALVLADFEHLDGRAVQESPRAVLRTVVDRLAGLGYTAMTSPELEFVVLRGRPDELAESDFRDLTPLGSSAIAYGAQRATDDERVIGPIRQALEGLGVEIEASNAEAGLGQYELNLPPHPGLHSGDQAFLFKHTVREVADLHGYTATFMARPIAEGFGSSCHVHQSLWTADGENAFSDTTDPDLLSNVGRHFIAGQLATLREFAALFAPTINSYKRYLPESAAGTTRTWAFQAKTVGVRVCTDSPNSTRVEHRAPGADANPYLVLAATLAGGIWGIENELDPGPPYRGNAYTDPTVEQIPATLGEAVELFEQSEAANAVFGEDVVRFIGALRRHEVAQYGQSVTDWEIRRYLTRV